MVLNTKLTLHVPKIYLSCTLIQSNHAIVRLQTEVVPFLTFALTSTTHAPYVSPGKQWEKYEHDEKGISELLNTIN